MKRLVLPFLFLASAVQAQTAGGMAAVVSAIQTDLGRRVAIKVVPPRVARSPSGVERFLREAKAASAIESDHVVKVFDVGSLESGTPFMVMEFLVGAPLARFIERRGALPLAEGLDYVLQAMVAVAHCHAIGLVHRDLKPENIMVLENPGQRGHVKVLDFGISKAEWFEQEYTPSLTGTSEVFGTPTHMSPEQVRSSKSVDHRTDIWSLGVVLYEVVTGKPPFLAESLPALSAMIVSDEPVPPAELRPDLPPDVARAIQRCLAKRPEQRPQTVQELAALLAPHTLPSSRAHLDRIFAIASAPVPLSSPAASAGVSGGFSAIRSTASAWGTTQGKRLGGRRGLVLAASAFLVLVSAVTTLWLLISRFRVSHEEPVERTVATETGPSPSGPSSAAAPTATPAAEPAVSGSAAEPPKKTRPNRRSNPLSDRY